MAIEHSRMRKMEIYLCKQMCRDGEGWGQMAPESRSHSDGGRKKKRKEGEEAFTGTAQHPGLRETRNRLK